MPSRRSISRRGVTLLELTVVTAVLAILAASVTPAIVQIEGARLGAAADEIDRMLTFVRTHAMATGEPSGLDISVASNTAEMVRLDASGGGIESVWNLAQNQRRALDIGSAFPGAALQSLTNGDGSGADGVIWFAFDGSPETRNSSGGSPAAFTQDAEIELSGGNTVTVRRYSGLIE